MQPCHRGNEAQPEPASGLGTAGLKPDEAVENAIAIRARHSRPSIGDDDFCHGSLGLNGHADFGLRSIAAVGALWRSIFNGVVNEIGNGLAEQLAIGANKDGLDGLGSQRDATFLGHRFVQLGHVVHNSCHVETLFVITAGSGLQPRNRKERVEGLNQPIGLVDRALQRLALSRLAVRLMQCGFDSIAQAVERCLEIVRDVVGDLAQSRHQLLDPRQHQIEALRQPIELVA